MNPARTLGLLVLTFALLQCGDEVPLISPPCSTCGELTYDVHPSWSPDGKQIAFFHLDLDSSSKDGLYILNLSINQVTRIVEGNAGRPSWSPDGKWIAFEKDNQIWKMEVERDSIVQLTTQGNNWDPSWSPNGQWIAYDSDLDSHGDIHFIWKMRVDGSDSVRITYDPALGPFWMANWAQPNLIVHSRQLGTTAAEIFTMDSVGGNERRLTLNSSVDSNPQYSSGAGKVLFTSSGSQTTLFMINLDGTGLVDTGEAALSGDWNPTGDSIVYTNLASDNNRLWIMSKDGSGKRQVTQKSMF